MDQALTLKLPSQTHLRAFVPPPASYSVTQDESLCAATMPGNGQGPTRPAAVQSPLGCLGTSEQWGPGAPSSAEPGLCASAWASALLEHTTSLSVVGVVVQLLSCIWFFVTPWTAGRQASMSFTISQNLLKHMSIELMIPSNHFILCCPFSFCAQTFPASRSFPVIQFFTSGGQSTRVSALASVLLMNIPDWFPLELTGLISLLSKGLSRVFSNTTVWTLSSSALSLLYGLALTSIHDYWKNHSFDYPDLRQQSNVSAV